MRAVVTVNMDGAAFEDGHGMSNPELARILRRAADRCRYLNVDGPDGLPLRDINGNRVGTLVIEERCERCGDPTDAPDIRECCDCYERRQLASRRLEPGELLHCAFRAMEY